MYETKVYEDTKTYETIRERKSRWERQAMKSHHVLG